MVEKWFQTIISTNSNSYLVKVKALRDQNARKLAKIMIADILDIHEALLEATPALETDDNTEGFHLITNAYIRQES